MVNESEFRNRHFETRGIVAPTARVADGFEPRQDQRELVHAMQRTLGVVQRAQKEETGKARSIQDIIEGTGDKEPGCDIPYNTWKKYMGLKRQVTRPALAKFAIGLGLSPDEANGLFRLQGGELNDTNDFDYIVIHALRDKDSVMDFQKEAEKYTTVSFGSYKQGLSK